jgi:hypothetical protein
MKRGILLSTIVLFTLVTTGSSKCLATDREARDLTGFTKVSFSVAGNLYINLGDEYNVVLEGETSLLENIVTEVSNGRLVIKKKSWRINMNDKVTVYVTMPELKGLGVSGSGKAEIKDAVNTNDLDLSVSGSGKLFTSDVTVSSLGCSISGSGDIIIGGKGDINRADVSISGSGNYNGTTAEINTMDVSISGSGSCTCFVKGSLRAGISGSGNVTYLGDPRIDARVSGSGRVRSK